MELNSQITAACLVKSTRFENKFSINQLDDEVEGANKGLINNQEDEESNELESFDDLSEDIALANPKLKNKKSTLVDLEDIDLNMESN